MKVRQYIGARYVPKFSDINGGVWDDDFSYEPLTIVKYGNDFYTSKIAVPAGVSISNTTYWVKTGDYNGAISSIDERLTDLENEYKGIFIFVADYDDETNPIQAAIDYGKSLMVDGESSPIIVISKDYEVNNISIPVGMKIFATKNVTLTQPAGTAGSFVKIHAEITTSVLPFEDGRKMGPIFMGGRITLISADSAQSESSVGLEINGTTSNGHYYPCGMVINNVSIYNFGIGVLNAGNNLYIYTLRDIYIGACLTAVKFAASAANSGENITLEHVTIDHCVRCIHVVDGVHELTCNDCSFDYNGNVFFNEFRVLHVIYNNGWIEAVGGGTSAWDASYQNWTGFNYLIYENGNAISPSETTSNVYDFNGTYINYSNGIKRLCVNNSGILTDGDDKLLPEAIVNFNTCTMNGSSSYPTTILDLSIGQRKNIEVNIIKCLNNFGVHISKCANYCRNIFTALAKSSGDSVSADEIAALGITASRNDLTYSVINDYPTGLPRGLRVSVPSGTTAALEIDLGKLKKYSFLLGFSSNVDGYATIKNVNGENTITSYTYDHIDTIASRKWIFGTDFSGLPYDKHLRIGFVASSAGAFYIDLYNINITPHQE